jgi:hypothetical protein
MKVWEAISDYGNVTEAQARELCISFIEAEIECPPDDPASIHSAGVREIIRALDDAVVRSEILTSGEGSGNPKVNESDLLQYVKHYSGTYDCVICGDQNISAGGVQLSCSLSGTPCKAVFCIGCIGPWVTECISRCPTCRKFCDTIKNLPIKVSPKKYKVIISLKKVNEKKI